MALNKALNPYNVYIHILLLDINLYIIYVRYYILYNMGPQKRMIGSQGIQIFFVLLSSFFLILASFCSNKQANFWSNLYNNLEAIFWPQVQLFMQAKIAVQLFYWSRIRLLIKNRGPQSKKINKRKNRAPMVDRLWGLIYITIWRPDSIR